MGDLHTCYTFHNYVHVLDTSIERDIYCSLFRCGIVYNCSLRISVSIVNSVSCDSIIAFMDTGLLNGFVFSFSINPLVWFVQ